MITSPPSLSLQAMRECIEQFCQLPEHRTADSSVVCLLSHGVDGAVYSTDGELLQVCVCVCVCVCVRVCVFRMVKQ